MDLESESFKVLKNIPKSLNIRFLKETKGIIWFGKDSLTNLRVFNARL
ncbi:hypothetical protein CLV31_10655 [Algoriphagus aquaeductus]|jgi:hypothetical protein|uniref:Uncharacterized protein n=1 Tax=Algoriphagus aquaeductus TaxID=475299 RepID=A0A326RYE1_9BACT|nr:hypothetical protein CLV31_10655 [Algoriphagus aquaeductus]